MKIYLVGAGKEFLEKIQRVLNSEGIEDAHIYISKNITPEELSKNLSDCEILVVSPSGFDFLGKEHIEAMPELKFITTTSVGIDWIDVEAVKERNIVLSNEKGVNAEAVAEHCFGMILSLSKRITEADRDIRKKGVSDPSNYMGVNLYGRTLGIIGLGDVGSRVARIAAGFSMKLVGVNKSNKKIDTVEIVDLNTLLQQSDVIVVTVPLTNETENMLSVNEFGLMKKGVILVSISREKVIDKQAVLEAINNEVVSGFGFDSEIMVPISQDDSWFVSNKIIVTPHTASVTEESDKQYATMTAENIKAFLDGSPVRTIS